MNETKDKINQLIERFNSFKQTQDLSANEQKIKQLESQSLDPNLWDDQDHAKSVMQDLGELRKDNEELQNIQTKLDVFAQIATEEELNTFEQDIYDLEKEIDKLETKTYLSGTYDRKNAIVGIHAGQGGTEAMDWASMLFRMYVRFTERREWKTSVIDVTYGEEAGIKGVIFKVEGSYAYGYLKGEAGAHRLVRQSPFNADKLRQTSFALVEVMPELDLTDQLDIEIKDEDLDIQFFRSGGHGGQNVNKVSTAVRLTHKPTGITVSAQTERFQEQNRKIALSLLRSKLWVLEQEKAKNAKKEIKGEYRPASWGTQIRSYVLHPYKMIKDLRTDIETGNTEAVLDGDLDQFIDAELKLKGIS